jgi:hypothetical protein
VSELTEKALQPTFELAGFQMKVLGRQFPDHNDFWDGNWLNVTCKCVAFGSRVGADGPFVHLSGIAELLSKLESLYATKSNEEIISFIEPTLNMAFKMGTLGSIEFDLSLTPDHMNQSHRFTFALDQSYLPAAIQQCKNILLSYPIKDDLR